MLLKNVDQYIFEKIEQLQSALFFPESSDRIIPTCILKHVKADDQEQLWFTIPKPLHAIDSNNTSFPCRMDFFKKGATVHVKLSGLATIVDEASMNTSFPHADLLANSDHQQLIIKVKVEQADCFEVSPMPTVNKKNNVMDFVSNAYDKIAGQFFGKVANHQMNSYS